MAFATFEPDPDGGFALSTEVADKARPPLFKQKQKKNSPVKILVSNQYDRYYQLKKKHLSSGKTEISSPAKLCWHQVSQVVVQVKELIFPLNFSRYKAK